MRKVTANFQHRQIYGYVIQQIVFDSPAGAQTFSEGEEEGQHENHEKAEYELKRGADAEVVGE